MEVRYYPSTDMLNIELSSAKSVESEEVHDGFVFDFDADGRVVSIEVDQASERVNLELIRKDAVVDEAAIPQGTYYTAAELAERLQVSKQTLHLAIRNMREEGVTAGLRPDVDGTLYSEQDEVAIRKWREAHPRGRPRTTANA